MTTKAIAEAVGKPEKTVRTWAAKVAAKTAEAAAKLSVATPSHPADWTLNETIAIIELGLGKNAAALYRMSAKQPLDENTRLDRLEALTERLLIAIGTMVMEKPAAAAPAQIEAPKLETRDELRRVINKAGKASGDYSGTWNLLYQEIYYRMHRNVNECAKNRGMDKLDYIESEGLLPEAIAIARDVLDV